MFNKIKTFKSLFFLYLIFGITSFSYAATNLETVYREIGGKTLTADSTLVDIVAYYFNLAVVLGTVIAVVIIVYAGFNLVNSRGEPAKVSEARNKIANAFFGLVILFGSFLIVNSINPDIFKIEDIKTEKCLNGIYIVSGTGTAQKEYCLQGSQTNLDLESISTIKWKIDKNTTPSIYVYDQVGYKGNISEIKNGETIPSGTKSIFFITNQEGLYLYDAINYMPKDRATPFIVNQSIEYLNDTSKDINGLSYDNVIKSIYIKQPSSGNYNAILFSDPSFTGTCSYIVNSVANLNVAGASFNNNKPAIGQGILSSIEVFKSYPTITTRGTIILYNNTGCQDSENDQVKRCVINIPDGSARIDDIASAPECKNFTGEVQSIRISGSGGIVLKTGGVNDFGYCQRWIKPVGDTCIKSIEGSNVYSGYLSGLRPKSFIVFPIN
jgi:hypothetical protein